MNFSFEHSIDVNTLKQVIEKTINAVVVTDNRGLITWINKGFERMTGFQFDEVIGKKPGDLLQGEKSDPEVIQTMRTAIETAEPFEVTIYNYTKQGEGYWNCIECMPLYEADEHTGFLAIQTDVTSRIEFQNQLIEANRRAQENSERLLLAFAGGQVGSWDWNPIEDEVYFHESWENLVGARPGSLEHKLETWEQRIHPDDIDSFTQKLAFITRDKHDTFVSEHRLLCKEKHYRWTMARGHVVERDVAGNPTRVVGVHLDISEQKRTQELLDEQNDLLQTILEVIPFAVSWKDSNSIYLGCNDRFLEFSGYSDREQVIGKSERDLHFAMEEAEYIISEDQAIVQSGKPLMHKIEKRISVNDEPKILDTSKVPLRIFDGTTGLLKISIDITELEVARESLRQNELKARHRGRMEAVGELAGGIAHEFNNLLQAIGGFVSFARDDISPDSQPHTDLTQSLAAISRATQLTNQLLRFSRIDEVEKYECNSLSIIEDLKVLLRPLLPENINVDYQLNGTLPLIIANPLLLGQSLLNLCLNSRDAMPAGGTITIGNRLITSQQKTFIGFYVQDNGLGIPEYLQDRIFDPFFTTKEVGQGTGLGLSMVYSTAQEHRGSIEFESLPGQGARFELLIPVISDNHQPEDSNQTDSVEMKNTNIKSILVAEDDSIVMRVTCRMLENLGYQVFSTNNGREALEMYRQERDNIHCLVFDVCMPLMTGTEAYDEICRLGNPPPVVFCTGYDTSQKLKNNLSQKGYRLINKPFDQKALEKAINNVFLEAAGEE